MKKLFLLCMSIILVGCSEVSVENGKSDSQTYSVICHSDGYYHLQYNDNDTPSITPCSQSDHQVCGDGSVIATCDDSLIVFKCANSELSPGIESISCTTGSCKSGICVEELSTACVEGLNCDGKCEDGVCKQECHEGVNCDGKCEDGICKQECQEGVNCDGKCEDGICKQECQEGVNCDGKCEDGVCKQKCQEGVNCDGKCEDGVCKQECQEGVNCDGKCEDGVCKQECIEGVNCDGKCEDGVCKQECQEGVNCDGKCEEGVCKPIEKNVCGDMGDGSFRVCDLENLQSYRKLTDKSSINKLIFHGIIMCDETCENIPSDNLESIIGDDAVISSYVPLKHPLFSVLKDGVSISDLTLNVDLRLTNPTATDSVGAHGILANEVKNVKLTNVIVKGVELSVSGKMNEAGTLFGRVNGGTFTDIQMSDVHISMSEGSEYQYECGQKAQYSTDIGGMIGLVEGVVEINQPIIKDMTISARGAARVGGLIGYAHGEVTIEGKYDGKDDCDNDISGLIVQHAERDAGGMIGRVGEIGGGTSTVGNAMIKNVKVSIAKVDTRLQCAGGFVGAVYYGRLNVKNSNVYIIDLNSSGYAGGILGKAYKTNDSSEKPGIEFSNIDILTESIVGSKNSYNCSSESSGGDYDTDETQGNRVGGVIGGVKLSKILIESIKNEFRLVSGSDQVGGLQGHGYAVDLTIHDVTNRNHSTAQPVSVKAVADASGFIGSINVTHAEVNNIINEVNRIETSGSLAACLMSYISFNDSSDNTLSNIISNCDVNAKVNSSGFISALLAGGDNCQIKMSNIVSKSNVEASNDTLAGFVNFIKVPKYQTLCSFNESGPDYWKCEENLQISNVLVESNLKASNKRVNSSNIMRDLVIQDIDDKFHDYHSNDQLCGDTTYNSYKYLYPSCYGDDCYNMYGEQSSAATFFTWLGFSKNAIRSLYSNVYYSTPGFIADDWDNDNWETTTRALFWCGGKYENSSSATNHGGEQCVYHRAYTCPINRCWFTDYIYHMGFDNEKNSQERVNSINPEDAPIKPYHPYFAKMSSNNDDVSITSKEEEKSNQPAVLDALNNKGHGWSKCSELAFANSNMTFDKDKYPNLLCPILTGERTCMGKWEEGKCKITNE